MLCVQTFDGASSIQGDYLVNPARLYQQVQFVPSMKALMRAYRVHAHVSAITNFCTEVYLEGSAQVMMSPACNSLILLVGVERKDVLLLQMNLATQIKPI